MRTGVGITDLIRGIIRVSARNGKFAQTFNDRFKRRLRKSGNIKGQSDKEEDQ